MLHPRVTEWIELYGRKSIERVQKATEATRGHASGRPALVINGVPFFYEDLADRDADFNRLSKHKKT